MRSLRPARCGWHPPRWMRALSSDWVERGPDNIGARVTDLAVDPSNSNIIYAAHATSGVFKTVDGGATWFPISDDLPVLTIGAIAVDPQRPEVLYAGHRRGQRQLLTLLRDGHLQVN